MVILTQYFILYVIYLLSYYILSALIIAKICVFAMYEALFKCFICIINQFIQQIGAEHLTLYIKKYKGKQYRKKSLLLWSLYFRE